MGINRKRITRAIETLSAEDFRQVLESGCLEAADLEDLIGLLRRNGRLLIRRQDPAKEAVRDAFLASASHSVERILGYDGGERIRSVAQALKRAECGYRDIDQGLRNAASWALPSDRHLNAVFAWAALTLDDVRCKSEDRASTPPSWISGDPLILQDIDGLPFDADGATSAIVGALGSFIKLLLDRTLSGSPSLPMDLFGISSATADEIHKAGTSILLANSYKRWRALEERCRFHGGEIIELRAPDLPAGTAPTIEVIREFRPDGANVHDFVSNERLADIFQLQWDRLTQSPPPFGYHGLQAKASFADDSFLSQRELASVMALRGLWGETTVAEAEFHGLTLRAWTRAYSVLSAKAEEARASATPFERTLIRFHPGELEDLLMNQGLSEQDAASFIDAATFGRTSEDLFDCPLLPSGDGGKLLFGPACDHTVPGRVVLSNLSTLGEKFDHKGRWFEREVLTFFQDRGFPAYTILKTKIGKEEYQVDVLVPWDRNLFVFECKHENLSAGRPIPAHNIDQANSEHVKQVLRQVKALKEHPRISIDAGGPDPNRHIVVPVVLHALPYCIPGIHNGVFIADWSAVSRFFEGGDIGVWSSHMIDEKETFDHRTVVYPLWSGDKPTVQDFLRNLEAPFQYAVNLARLEVVPSKIYLCDHRWAFTPQLVRNATDLKGLMEELGRSPNAVAHGLRQARQTAARRRVSKEKLALRDADRRWRDLRWKTRDR